jgi:hypothetical protein
LRDVAAVLDLVEQRVLVAERLEGVGAGERDDLVLV